MALNHKVKRINILCIEKPFNISSFGHNQVALIGQRLVLFRGINRVGEGRLEIYDSRLGNDIQLIISRTDICALHKESARPLYRLEDIREMALVDLGHLIHIPLHINESLRRNRLALNRHMQLEIIMLCSL